MALPLQVTESGLGRFQDDWFAVFVRCRPYSLPGADEWVMFHKRSLLDEHERLATGIAAAAGPVPTVRMELP